MKNLIYLMTICINCYSQSNLWKPLNGLFADRIFTCATFKQPNLLFVGTHKGMLCSTDSGMSWYWTNGKVSDKYISSCIVTEKNNFIAASTSGIYRSEDDGNNWVSVLDGVVYSLSTDYKGHLYAGAANGFFVSTNDGLEWIQMNKGLVDTRVTAIAVDSLGSIFAGTYSEGLFYSTDHGSNWTRSNLSRTSKVQDIAIDKNGFIFVCSDGYLDRSIDGGNIWSSHPFTVHIQSLAVNDSGYLFVGERFNVGKIQINNLFRSTDHGENWSRIDGFSDVFEANYGNFIFGVPTPGVLFRSSDNGESWLQNSSQQIRRVECVTVDSQNRIFVAGADGCYFSDDKGNSWVDISPKYGGYSAAYVSALTFDLEGNIFAGDVGSRFFRSTNLGTTWTQLTFPVGMTLITALSVDSSGTIFASTSSSGIYRSSDKGNYWITINNGLNDLHIYALTFSSDGKIIAGSGNGVYQSIDKGNNWQRIDQYIIKEPVVTIISPSPSIIFVGTYLGGVYRSNDAGISWTQINEGLPNLYVRSLVAKDSSNIICAVDTGGIFLLSNNTAQWVNIGLADISVRQLSFTKEGFLLAGTWGDRIFQSVDILTKVDRTGATKPNIFTLNQNSPNPFNPTTLIRYKIAENQKVTLKVYDVLGREVATLLDGYTEIGEYTITFNASHLSSGMYFYELKAGNYRSVKKMLLMK